VPGTNAAAIHAHALAMSKNMMNMSKPIRFPPITTVHMVEVIHQKFLR
jgi:hypothetical protein